MDENVRLLLSKRKRIQEFLFTQRDAINRTKRTREKIPTDWVLDMAENITLTLRAPNDWTPGRPLFDLSGHPPAPQFEQMRVGVLAQLHEKYGIQFMGQSNTFETGSYGDQSGDVLLDDQLYTRTIVDADQDVEDSGDDSNQEDSARDLGYKAIVGSAVEVHVVKASRKINIDFMGGDDDEDEDD